MVGCPIVGINDSGGARIQDAVTSLAWYAELGRRHESLSGLVPQISLIFGKCAAGAVYSPIQTDLVVAVRDQGYMFVTGPDVIREVTGEDVSLDELGGADAQARYGNIHQVVDSEAEAFQYVRDFLSFLPSNCFEQAADRQPGAGAGDHAEPIWSSTRSCRTPTMRPTTCTKSCCGSSTTAISWRSPRSPGRPSSPGMPASTGVRSVWSPTSPCTWPDRSTTRRPTRPRGSSASATRSKFRWCSWWTHPGSCRGPSRRRTASSSAAAGSSTRWSRPTCRR